MPSLPSRAWRAVFVMAALASILLFVSAGDLQYWQGWLLLAAYFIPLALLTHQLIRTEPQLLARRLEAGVAAEPRPAQKFIIATLAAACLALLVFPALEHRHGREALAPLIVVAGDLLVVLGTALIAAVCRANPYSAASIRVEKGQPLVTEGPYAIVRHPMYAGMCVHLLGVPLALGYLVAYAPAALILVLLVWRLLDEERELIAELPGYPDYMKQVRYRLVPGLW
jgi:protein-S-isoprenylcysteine O-methyltransferase Ste14